jgi:hypothetical protein
MIRWLSPIRLLSLLIQVIVAVPVAIVVFNYTHSRVLEVIVMVVIQLIISGIFAWKYPTPSKED